MPTAIVKKDKKQRKKDGEWTSKKGVLTKKDYEQELRRLQVELVQLEEWVRHRGLRVVAIFEGRDTAGKGGVIKRMTALLIRGSRASSPCRRRPREKELSGTSSGMSRTCPRRER